MKEALIVFALTFAASVPWGGRIVRALLRHGIGKRIRSDGPSAHLAKAGTATMGGLYFVGTAIIATLVLAVLGITRPLWVLVAVIPFALLGAMDDLRGLKDRTGIGWRFGDKFPLQWAVAFVVAVILYLGNGAHIGLRWWGGEVRLGLWAIPLGTFLLVASSNAVNLADGVDGLAGGISAIAYLAMGTLAILAGGDAVGLFGFVMAGALCAFLWYNVHPAHVFMGDIGAEALGAGLAAMALLSGHILLLPIVGVLLVAEALSDIIQVSYFKYTRRKFGEGRRVFRMAPLHHHFELGGWSETQVTARFWLAAAVAAAIGIAIGWWWR